MRTRLARLIRLMLPGGNPLSRGVDRVEGCSLLCVVVAGLALVPIMLMVGSLAYADVVAAGEQQAMTRHEVVATLVQDAPRREVGDNVNSGSRVLARWQSPDGDRRTGRVAAADGLDKGSTVRVWVDRNGRLSGPPATQRQAAAAGTSVAVAGWLVAACVLVLFHACLRRLLNRCRSRAWEREWARVEPEWRRDPR